jgi:methylmalonyl-CoA mutase cobalamin-binding subunit
MFAVIPANAGIQGLFPHRKAVKKAKTKVSVAPCGLSARQRRVKVGRNIVRDSGFP